MLHKPQNWDSIQAKEAGEYSQLPPGAYHCYIASAQAQMSRSKKKMLVLEFDIASGEYANFFANSQFKPKYYQLAEDENMEYLKGVITAIEQSNDGFIWDWNPYSLIHKECAVAFGEEEYEKDGNILTGIKPRFIKSLEKLRNGEISTPKAIKYKGTAGKPASYQPDTTFTGFESITDSIDDDLPF